MKCIAYIRSDRAGNAWKRCSGRAARDSILCGRHRDAANGVVLGLMVNGFPERPLLHAAPGLVTQDDGTKDTKERRILIGAPLGTATSPNKILMLDYRDLDDAEDIASRPPINVTYAGRKTAADKTRKWTPWTIAANACYLVERSDGTASVVLGGGTPGVGGGGPTGRVYQLSDSQLSDNGIAIPSYYTTHYFPERAVEQTLNLGAHRKLFTYLTMFVEGAGNLSLTSFTDTPSAPQSQQPLPLSSPSAKDLELPINVLGERVAFQVSTNQAGAWFRLQKFTPSVRVDPWAPARGFN